MILEDFLSAQYNVNGQNQKSGFFTIFIIGKWQQQKYILIL